MQVYSKNWKKQVSKKNSLISKNKFKGKSKCTVCLTGRTFIDKIKDEYDLESEVEVYLQFLTDWCYKIKWRIEV